jgi:hypothetical protein
VVPAQSRPAADAFELVHQPQAPPKTLGIDVPPSILLRADEVIV